MVPFIPPLKTQKVTITTAANINTQSFDSNQIPKPQVQITIRARETVELSWGCGMAYASALPVNTVFSVVGGGAVCVGLLCFVS